MFKRIAICLILSISFVSCNEREKKEDSDIIIDRKKIDAVFNKNVSKLLLDHLYVVVDSITYERLTNDNQWKNTYASLDLGLPDFAPVHDHSSTCYLRGHQHYIEILGPKNSYNEPVGKSGIGFSLQNQDEHFHLGVQPKMKASKDSFLYATETVEIPLGLDQHTWFKAFYTPSPGTALHTWYAFYNPVFLDSLYGKHHTSYSREAFLKPTYANKKLFNGIKEIYLTCTPEDYLRITQELGYLRCKLLKKNGKTLTIKGGDITVRIEPSGEIEYSRITQITCELNEKDHSIIQLGNLTITNQGTESIWNFDQLYINNP
ncbi:hypothetical protein SAMN04487910_2879 [Aquimarina amphilecti]|uniref:Uncharacterized protein n=1 Tax=Aquimarina amphilecti TaxID=1038014 RepID=A0A1H7RUQ7_AQUAM|nr:DUF5829 family protein [Aquimarina amphilecti]SEL63895.1 hypothetical protein SAMN04487910_2879 [Aquimarina amphilecti]